jgi:hypothetical protein
MLQRALLFLSISSMASAVVEKTIPNPRQGESCNMGEPDFFVQLGKDKPSPVETCISKCVDDEFCEGMEFKAPRRCYLYYNRIGKVRTNRDELLSVHFDQYLLRISHILPFQNAQ